MFEPAEHGPTSARLLIVSANREHFPEPAFPIGAAYLAHAAQAAGVEVAIFDASLSIRPLGALAAALRRFRPDLVGLSLRNVDNAIYRHTALFLPWYRELVRCIRNVCKVPIVLGGSGFSIFAREFLEQLGAEVGVTGDGEAGIVQILGMHSHAARGITAGSITSPVRCIHGALADLNGVEFPRNLPKLLPNFGKYRTIGLQTSRGCPHRCIYCSYPIIEGRVPRRRSPEKVVDDIEYLVRSHGKQEFFIVDSAFNADEHHMMGVLEAIVRRKLSIRFGCYMQPRFGNYACLSLAARAGCVGIDFGTDSGSERMLEALGKNFGARDVVDTSRACRKAGIDFCHSLMFGGPGETVETVGETARLMEACQPTAVVPMTAIRIYPNTPLARRAVDEGVVSTHDSLFEPRFYFGGWDPNELYDAARKASGSPPNWRFTADCNWRSYLSYRIASMFFRKRPIWRNLRTRNGSAHPHDAGERSR